MGFKLSHTIVQLKKDAEAAAKKLEEQDALKDIYQVLGIQLLSFAQLDYREKSRGGGGSDGSTWKPITAATQKAKQRRGRKQPAAIGIDTGLQLNSAQPQFKASDGKGGNVFNVDPLQGVTVGFGREYSEFFDEKRKLMPDVLPQEWRDALDELVVDWADTLVKEELE